MMEDVKYGPITQELYEEIKEKHKIGKELTPIEHEIENQKSLINWAENRIRGLENEIKRAEDDILHEKNRIKNLQQVIDKLSS